EAEFLLGLLMRLLTDPSGLDRGGERLEAGVGRQVGHIVFLLARRPALANEPDFVARHALHAIIGHSVLVAVSDTNATGGKETCQTPLRAAPPVDPSPLLAGQGRFGGDRRLIRNAVFARSAGLGGRKDQSDVGGIDILAFRQANRPLETALAQSLTERPAGPVTGISENAAEAHAGGDHAVDLSDRDFRLRQRGSAFLRHASPRHAFGIVGPVFWQEQP